MTNISYKLGKLSKDLEGERIEVAEGVSLPLTHSIQQVTNGDLTFYLGIEQGSQEWLDLRSKYITCSNAATLITRGKNFCLEANKKSMERTTPNGNSYADRGHVIENDTREELNAFLKPMGMRLETCAFITNKKYPGAGYSPDGLIVPLKSVCWWEEDFIPVEFKAYNDVVIRQVDGEKKEVRTNKHLKATKDFENVPMLARAQCQMEMLLTGTDMVCLVLSNPDAVEGEDKVKVWWVHKEELIQERLIKKLL